MRGDDWDPLGKGEAASDGVSRKILQLGGGIQRPVLTQHYRDQRRA